MNNYLLIGIIILQAIILLTLIFKMMSRQKEGYETGYAYLPKFYEIMPESIKRIAILLNERKSGQGVGLSPMSRKELIKWINTLDSNIQGDYIRFFKDVMF